MEAGSPKKQTTEEQFAAIGKFLTQVNIIEFILNNLLESVIAAYPAVSDTQNEINDTIDHVEEQSIKIRTGTVILCLTITKKEEPEIQVALTILKDFYKKYNKYIRPIRDFIAHNSLVPGDTLINDEPVNEPIIVSSRRHKKGLNSLTISEMEAQRDLMHSLVRDLYNVMTIIHRHYSLGTGREFSRS